LNRRNDVLGRGSKRIWLAECRVIENLLIQNSARHFAT
jgi:hypothetical protein